MSCSCKLFAVHLLFDVITEQINDDDDDAICLQCVVFDRIDPLELCMAGVRRGTFTCVGWQVTLCDPIWQVTSIYRPLPLPFLFGNRNGIQLVICCVPTIAQSWGTSLVWSNCRKVG